jgi:hypothetical protein
MSSHRISNAVLRADLDAQVAWQPHRLRACQRHLFCGKHYNCPHRHADCSASRTARFQTALDTARDAAAAAEWRFHEAMLAPRIRSSPSMAPARTNSSRWG